MNHEFVVELSLIEAVTKPECLRFGRFWVHGAGVWVEGRGMKVEV
jgi:hypothetical protein